MLDQNFIYLATFIIIVGGIGYATDTFRGRTQPNRVSWLLWGIAPIIGFAAQLSEGVGLTALITLSVGIGPLFVLAASWANKAAYWRVTKFDIWCGSISVLALILWAITGTGLIAIILSIVADLMAGVPTIIKAYNHPESEYANAFLAGIIGTALTVLTFKTLDFSTTGFAIYLLLVNLLLFVLIQFPKLRLPKLRTSE